MQREDMAREQEERERAEDNRRSLDRFRETDYPKIPPGFKLVDCLYVPGKVLVPLTHTQKDS